ncbi:MgtC/SapB family protein [uncultured Fibrobacter sp.]|uniref:MgtC/SapB family protein n=1 Tax=uncultured Fibrobacter sp. TaxID=261512 RepID=UPI002604DA7B|nr:MgtC/SapB family protein [uncultured Fibrobacter sp.]
MLDLNVLYRLAAAIGIGLIIGMQREHTYFDQTDRHPAGVRTFTLVALVGAMAALLSDQMGGVAPFVTGFVVVGMLLMATHISFAIGKKNCSAEIRSENRPLVGGDGITTSVALVIVYLLGGVCWYGRLVESCVIVVVMLWVLSAKEQLHTFAKKLSKEDVLATVKFAVISALILPFLPNQTYGPPGLEVLNPHTIWLFVVFISGIGFVGYVLIKIVGPGKGIWLTGLLGGLASSTALTLNLTGRSRENEDYASDFTAGIVLSWAVMYVRLYLICIFLSASLARPLALPLLLPVVPALVYAIYLKVKDARDHKPKNADFANPFKLLPAIKFGVVFTCVMFVANAARVYLGSGALIACSFLGGAAEMDAVAFSVIDMNLNSGLAVRELVLALLFASLANTLTKGGMVFFLGAKSMRRPILPAVILIVAVTVGLIAYLSFST